MDQILDNHKSLQCEVSEPMPLAKTGHVIGIDMGINALITTNDGEQVKNPRWNGQAQAEVRRKQRKLARTKRGSNQRKKKLLDVQRQHEQVKNMVQNRHLSKRILDAGGGYFRKRLLDKAADAGREVVVCLMVSLWQIVGLNVNVVSA